MCKVLEDEGTWEREIEINNSTWVFQEGDDKSCQLAEKEEGWKMTIPGDFSSWKSPMTLKEKHKGWYGGEQWTQPYLGGTQGNRRTGDGAEITFSRSRAVKESRVEGGSLVFAGGKVSPKVTLFFFKMRIKSAIFASHENQPIGRAKLMMPVKGQVCDVLVSLSMSEAWDSGHRGGRFSKTT